MAKRTECVDALTIDPWRLAFDWTDAAMPIAFVTLDGADGIDSIRPPPFPVIGLGSADHPLARSLDAVAEPPFDPARLAEQAALNPRAAATLVEVLRVTCGIAVDDALTVESLAYAALQGSAEHQAWLAARPATATLPTGRLLVERKGATLRILVDRPDARNAIDRALRDGLADAFRLAALDEDIERVIWRATGPAFGVGADLTEFGATRDPATAHAIRRLTLPALPLARCAGKLDVHVQGACVGSTLEMAAFGGRISASPRAWFRMPELAMGIIPGAGGCVSLPLRVGRSRALLMMLSGRRIDAVTALRWGLIDEIVDRPAVDPCRIDADSGEIAPRIPPVAIEQA